MVIHLPQSQSQTLPWTDHVTSCNFRQVFLNMMRYLGELLSAHSRIFVEHLAVEPQLVNQIREYPSRSAKLVYGVDPPAPPAASLPPHHNN